VLDARNRLGCFEFPEEPCLCGRFRLRPDPYPRGLDDRFSAAKVEKPIKEWRIVAKDRYPACIDWPTCEKIRSIVSDNRAEYMRTRTRAAPRDGELLLHGIAWCAQCGRKMYVRYKGDGEYVCNHLRSHSGLDACQHIRAARVDGAVADTFLTALEPAERDALSRARQARNQVDDALRANAKREVERTRARRCCAVWSRKWFSTGG